MGTSDLPLTDKGRDLAHSLAAGEWSGPKVVAPAEAGYDTEDLYRAVVYVAYGHPFVAEAGNFTGADRHEHFLSFLADDGTEFLGEVESALGLPGCATLDSPLFRANLHIVAHVDLSVDRPVADALLSVTEAWKREAARLLLKPLGAVVEAGGLGAVGHLVEGGGHPMDEDFPHH